MAKYSFSTDFSTFQHFPDVGNMFKQQIQHNVEMKIPSCKILFLWYNIVSGIDLPLSQGIPRSRNYVPCDFNVALRAFDDPVNIRDPETVYRLF